MNKLKYYFSSKRQLKARLQTACEERDGWKSATDMWHSAAEKARELSDSVKDQLHRVARERDREREKRLEAEDRLFDYIVDSKGNEEE